MRTHMAITAVVLLLAASLSASPGRGEKGAPGRVLFGADDGTHGMELWVSDGSRQGTVLVKDINPGPLGSGPGEMVAMGGRYYFSAYDRERGRELWATDGTAAGTTLVRDINPGPGDSFPSRLVAAGGLLHFRADDGTHGLELWVTDGTSAGTRLVKDINPGGDATPTDLMVF